MFTSCQKDDVNKKRDNFSAISSDFTPSSKTFLHEADTPEGIQEPDPEVDCKCYLQVKSVFFAPLGEWGLFDVYPDQSTSFEMEGLNNDTWTSPAGEKPLPSDFLELNPPSNGQHMFYMTAYANSPNDVNPNYEINSTVKCYLQNPDGSETLSTTTDHTFVWSEGTNIGGEFINYSAFWRDFLV